MSNSGSDRNLLLAILAVQMDFVSPTELIEAMNAWILDKARPIDVILEERGALYREHRELLEPLVDAHIRRHGGDATMSLEAIHSVASIQEILCQVQASEIGKTFTLDKAAAGRNHSSRVAPPSPAGEHARFQILRHHASGGLGEVFVARDHELGREVALKQIQAAHAGNAQSRERFVREAEITGGLEHPGIVPVYGLGQNEDGRPYYAMRFVRGASLKEAIDTFHQSEFRSPSERNLALRELLGHFLVVCNAVDYAHSRGVLHRDLKPANVMLGKFGETLVVDWGLAKVVGRDEDGRGDAEATLSVASGSGSSETLPGSAIGTPAFMSPEQADGQLDALGPATDVYSLGATLYTLLVGKPAFLGNAHQVLERVRRGEVSSAHSIDRRAPKALSAIAAKAMARQPRDRYPTSRALARDVEAWLADEPVSALRESFAARLARRARRHRTAVAAAFLLLLAGIAGLAANRVLVGIEQEKKDRALEEARLAQAAAEASDIAANEARARAEQTARRERQNSYFANISAAQQAWGAGDLVQTLEILDRIEKDPGQQEFLGFEFMCLKTLCASGHTTFRHPTESISCVAFSADGAQFAVGSFRIQVGGAYPFRSNEGNTPSVVLYRKAPGVPAIPVQDEGQGVTALCFSPDGGSIATANTDNVVRIWDTATGALIRPLQRARHSTQTICFSPKGDLLAYAIGDSTVGVVNPVTGEEIRQLPSQLGFTGIHGLDFSPDGHYLAIGSGLPAGPSVISLWDVGTWKIVSEWEGHEMELQKLKFSPDSTKLASAGGDRKILIWAVPRPNGPTAVLEGHDGIAKSLAWSPDGHRLISGGSDRTVRIWDLENRGNDVPLRSHTDTVVSVVVDPTTGVIASAGLDRNVSLWDAAYIARGGVVYRDESPNPFRSLFESLSPAIKGVIALDVTFALAMGTDGAIVTSGLSLPGTVKVWRRDSVAEPRKLTLPGPVEVALCLDVAPSGDQVVVGSVTPAAVGLDFGLGSPRLHVWDLASGKRIKSWVADSRGVAACRYFLDGKRIASIGLSGELKVWDAATGKPEVTFESRADTLPCLAVSPDGALLASGGLETSVRVWNARTGELLQSLPDLGQVTGLEFAPKDRLLAIATCRNLNSYGMMFDGEVTLFDLAKRSMERVLPRHAVLVRGMAFSPDGRRLATASLDGIVKIWDTASGRELASYPGQKRITLALAFSRDGKEIAVGDAHGSIWILGRRPEESKDIKQWKAALSTMLRADSDDERRGQ